MCYKFHGPVHPFAKFGVILGIIFLAATLALAVTHDEQEKLKTIIPSADSFVQKTAGGIEYFEAIKGNTVIGYCVRVTGNGYNGYIRMIVGVDPNGTIQGVAILEHNETPGLGARINETNPGEKEPWFLKQFRGKNARTVAIKKDIDAVTGATISSLAVTESVRKTVEELFSKLKIYCTNTRKGL